jgi:hypothetical protein
MTTTRKQVKDVNLTKPSLDYIMKECVSCQQNFIEKYWDNESNWYIELNLTRYCHRCLEKVNQ